MGGRRLFTYEVRESLASDSDSGGGGSSSCQVFYRAWDDDPQSGSRYETGACFETSSSTWRPRGAVVRTPSALE